MYQQKQNAGTLTDLEKNLKFTLEGLELKLYYLQASKAEVLEKNKVLGAEIEEFTEKNKYFTEQN